MSSTVVGKKSVVKSAVEFTKSDLQKSSTQVAARQIVKAVRAPISGLLAAKFGGKSRRSQQQFAAFLESPEGLGALKYILGVGLAASPLAQYHAVTTGTGESGSFPKNRLAEVADYLRVEGMTDLGDSFADLLTGPLFKGLEGVISSITELASTPAQLTPPRDTTWTKVNSEEKVAT